MCSDKINDSTRCGGFNSFRGHKELRGFKVKEKIYIENITRTGQRASDPAAAMGTGNAG